MQDEQNPLAKKIISLLVFEESFSSIVSELPDESRYALADEIKSLIVKDLVKPCKNSENNTLSGILYDSDAMNSYTFILTAKGLAYLENNLKT
ncbi:MAG: hypothetical protein R2852_00785 [Bacteroidia bacterium]